MMRKIRIMFAAMLVATLIGGATMTVATPQIANAAECSSGFLLFPPWYRGISKTEGSDKNATCEITSPAKLAGGTSEFIWIIVANVVEMGLVLVGYVSVGFIIWGGFQYMLVATNADRTVAARRTIVNAIAGLIVSFFSIALIQIVVGNIT